MAIKTKQRIAGGGYITLDLNLDEISEALHREIEAELSPVVDKMVTRARASVPIGSGRRDPRPVYESGSDVGAPWTARTPGTLKESIVGSIHIRKDKTAVIGFFEAGGFMPYYALMVERKTGFFSNAFLAFRNQAMDAIARAVANVAINGKQK